MAQASAVQLIFHHQQLQLQLRSLPGTAPTEQASTLSRSVSARAAIISAAHF